MAQVCKKLFGMHLHAFVFLCVCFSHYVGAQPVLLVSDLEMLKHIMVKEFDSFANRSVSGLPVRERVPMFKTCH